jgi:hypothetical protein
MYFWNTAALKQKLIERPLTDGEAFPYFLADAIMTACLIGLAPYATPDAWNTSYSLLAIPVIIVGTIHLYRSNAGPDGTQFLQRSLALGWVLGLRILALSILAAVILGFALYEAGPGEGLFAPAWFAVSLALLIGYYWRLGHHIRDVAAGAEETGETGGSVEHGE